MKAILTFVFLFVLQNSYSQTDTKKQESKPSWGNKMPTRETTPDLKFDPDLDEEDELDMSDLGMDRSTMLGLDESENSINTATQVAIPKVISAVEQKKIEKEKKFELERIKAQEEKDLQDRVAAEKLKEKKRQEELIAAEQLKEQIRLEDEKIAAEQLKEQIRLEDEKIAAEQLKEQIRLEEVKRIADQIAEEIPPSEAKDELTLENPNVPNVNQDQLETVVVAPKKQANYIWKKINNTLPEYPAKAARERKEGWVEVEITINQTGDVVNAVIVNSYRNIRIFNKAALKAVNKWTFEPPSNYGINNQLSKVVKIVFQL